MKTPTHSWQQHTFDGLISPIKARINLKKNRSRSQRFLEIGPGFTRIPGFETLDIVNKHSVDYVLDASKQLPFLDNTFEIVYASHVLEHIAWYRALNTLQEWARIIKPGGVLEIWVPNGLKICKAFVDAELDHNEDGIDEDGWYRFNPEKDVCKWASGRIFTYGDGHGDPCDANWHRALFSPRYLELLMNHSGLISIQKLDRSEVRGYDHGWINLGIKGIKP